MIRGKHLVQLTPLIRRMHFCTYYIMKPVYLWKLAPGVYYFITVTIFLHEKVETFVSRQISSLPMLSSVQCYFFFRAAAFYYVKNVLTEVSCSCYLFCFLYNDVTKTIAVIKGPVLTFY